MLSSAADSVASSDPGTDAPGYSTICSSMWEGTTGKQNIYHLPPVFVPVCATSTNGGVASAHDLSALKTSSTGLAVDINAVAKTAVDEVFADGLSADGFTSSFWAVCFCLLWEFMLERVFLLLGERIFLKLLGITFLRAQFLLPWIVQNAWECTFTFDLIAQRAKNYRH